MKLHDAIALVRSVHPKAKLTLAPTIRWRKRRYVVQADPPWTSLGEWEGYCQKSKAWKAAARHIKRGR